jgi:phage-related holin
MKVVLLSSAALGFVCDHILNITMTYNEQFLSVGFVVLLDGFFGVIAGIKREGFKTYKGLKVLRNLFTWWLIIFVVLSIEVSFKVSWLSETIVLPFMVFQIMSALKNASMAGFIKMELLNEILDKIDNHKGKRNVD